MQKNVESGRERDNKIQRGNRRVARWGVVGQVVGEVGRWWWSRGGGGGRGGRQNVRASALRAEEGELDSNKD